MSRTTNPPTSSPTPPSDRPSTPTSPTPTTDATLSFQEPMVPVTVRDKATATLAHLREAPSRLWGLPNTAGSGGEARDRSPAPDPDRTDTSGIDQSGPAGNDKRRRAPVNLEEISNCFAEVLQILANSFGWLVARRGGWELRRPTEVERRKVADPAARLAARHVGVNFLTDDLVDVVKVGAGFAGYVETKPLHRVHLVEGETLLEQGD